MGWLVLLVVSQVRVGDDKRKGNGRSKGEGKGNRNCNGGSDSPGRPWQEAAGLREETLLLSSRGRPSLIGC